jgi:hypothetical protein
MLLDVSGCKTGRPGVPSQQWSCPLNMQLLLGTFSSGRQAGEGHGYLKITPLVLYQTSDQALLRIYTFAESATLNWSLS